MRLSFQHLTAQRLFESSIVLGNVQCWLRYDFRTAVNPLTIGTRSGQASWITCSVRQRINGNVTGVGLYNSKTLRTGEVNRHSRLYLPTPSLGSSVELCLSPIFVRVFPGRCVVEPEGSFDGGRV